MPADKRLDFIRQAQEVQAAILGASDMPPAAGVVPGGLKMDPTRAFAGIAGGMIGAFVGFAVGSFAGFGVIVAIIAVVKDAPIVPIIILFFACPIAGAIGGGYAGNWWSRQKLTTSQTAGAAERCGW